MLLLVILSRRALKYCSGPINSFLGRVWLITVGASLNRMLILVEVVRILDLVLSRHLWGSKLVKNLLRPLWEETLVGHNLLLHHSILIL